MLKKRFGTISTIFLNYECVFLYLFLDGLSADDCKENIEFRCFVNPGRKIKNQINRDALEYASFINYLLAVLKIKDNYNDTGNILYELFYRFFCGRKAYKTLAKEYENMVFQVTQCCDKLYKYEKENHNDFDDFSKTMGDILQIVVKNYLQLSGIENEAAIEFAKHIGIWVYLIDAYDDFEKDLKKGNFNPLRNFVADKLNNNFTEKQAAYMMLNLISYNIGDYFKKCNLKKNTEIIENIVGFGMQNSILKIEQEGKGKKNARCGVRREKNKNITH